MLEAFFAQFTVFLVTVHVPAKIMNISAISIDWLGHDFCYAYARPYWSIWSLALFSSAKWSGVGCCSCCILCAGNMRWVSDGTRSSDLVHLITSNSSAIVGRVADSRLSVNNVCICKENSSVLLFTPRPTYLMRLFLIHWNSISVLCVSAARLWKIASSTR